MTGLAKQAVLALGGEWFGQYGAVASPGEHARDRSTIIFDVDGGDDVEIVCPGHSESLWQEIRWQIRRAGIELPWRDDEALEARTGEIDMSRRWRLIDTHQWATRSPPPLRWALDRLMPLGHSTYLTGVGASGKSLVGQQLATCVAFDLPFLGIPVTQSPALYLTCEDDEDELHRRQAAICRQLGIGIEDVPGKMHLISLAGELGAELMELDERGHLEGSEAYHKLENTIRSIGAKFVVLDNVAHLFAGNENDRHDVAAFCALMNRLARAISGAVLFIGHPNKSGDAFSGSTAWENQVRSRIYMETPKDGDGTARDPDLRVLRTGKSNYSQMGFEIEFRWHCGAFARDQDLPADAHSEIASTVLAAKENAAFLACLDKLTSECRASSSRKSASNYAPRLFVAMPKGKGYKEYQFEAAMNRLLHSGEMRDDQQLWKRPNRTYQTGLGRAQDLAQTVHKAGAQECTDHEARPSAHEVHETTAQHRLYTSYMKGEGPREWPSPDVDEELIRP